VGKYGTNLEGFGAFEGGVNADKGAPLVSTSSDGETALLFGPAALREIQAGVANGDFAIPPDEADATITAENPLPYWTFTDTSSSGAITCAIVTDASAGSSNILRWSVAANTTTTKSAVLSRFIPVAASRDQAYSYMPELALGAATSTTLRSVVLTMQFYKQDQTTTTGTALSETRDFSLLTGTVFSLFPSTNQVRFNAPSDAAFLKISIEVNTTGTFASVATIDMYEVRTNVGQPILQVAERANPAAYGPGAIWMQSGVLQFSRNTPTAYSGSQQDLAILTNGTVVVSTNLTVNANSLFNGNATVGGDIGFDGVIYGSSGLTGIALNTGGTNGRLWLHSSPAADVAASTSSTVSGVLITKVTAGQPSTNINGTATTDAFADALRNGGIAVDTTNNRGYFYSGGWKYAALTTPSDSRLKEEITDITGALDTLRQLVPVAFKWKRPEAHGRSDAVADDGTRLGFIADQVATTDLAHWVETLGVDEREADLVDTTEVLAVNIPQNEMEALVVQALLDIDTRLKALESR
jgi:hypothetical protein